MFHFRFKSVQLQPFIQKTSSVKELNSINFYKNILCIYILLYNFSFLTPYLLTYILSKSMSSEKFAVAQLGARMHYAVPRIFYNADVLHHIFTDIYADVGIGKIISSIPGFQQNPTLRKLRGRYADGIPSEMVSTFDFLGLNFWHKLRRAKNESEHLQALLWASDAFSRAICRKGFGSATAIYGFNSASHGIFLSAKANGIKTVLEQTIAPKVLEIELLSLHAGISHSLPSTSELDDYIAIEREEWDMADTIICASNFVRDGLVSCGISSTKCQVVPYGVDLSKFGRVRPKAPSKKTTKILFAGSIGTRKGIHILFEAMKKLLTANVECRVVGSISGYTSELARLCPSNTHIIGPVPRADIPHEMMEADIFCLPSLCEGSATVTYEALAAGLPVITTPNAGSIVRDGIDGFLVPVADSDALANAILTLTVDHELRREMSQNAILQSNKGSLSAYQYRLLSALGIER